MRIRSADYFALFDSSNACYGEFGGETEDYMITIDSTVGIADLGFGVVDFAMAPNPATNEVKISSPRPIKSLRLVTVTGSVVLTPTLSKGEGVSVVLNVKQLPQGIYFVEVQTERGVAVKKLVVMKE